MRREEQVIEEILDFAKSEERVRVVMMNGSRVNYNAPKDIMRDYDIVFFITDIDDMSYKTNRDWINRFGELVIMQQNDLGNGYIFLMQFKDGVRIDLRFEDVKLLDEVIKEDSLSKILLDKDNIVNELPLPNDSTHYVKKPTKKEFDKVLNEAWWIQTYIAKGIWRDELPYVKYMFDVILIDCIRKLLAWHIGTRYNWSINVGKCGKWLKVFLPDDIYNDFVSLYPGVDYYEIWHSLFRTGGFIRKIGIELAEKLGYKYPIEDDINVTEFIKKIKNLPKDAQDFI